MAEKHSACAPVRQADDRPNFIFIMADDLGYGEIEPYGQTKIRTPNLAAMSQDGLTFTDFYSGSTVCAPARNSLMTGRHTGHTFVRGNCEDDLPIPDTDLTIAEILGSRGYKTAIIGKWALGGPDSSGHPLSQGFNYFFGF
jgi:arylsulfatase A-like enzyme